MSGFCLGWVMGAWVCAHPRWIQKLCRVRRSAQVHAHPREMQRTPKTFWGGWGLPRSVPTPERYRGCLGSHTRTLYGVGEECLGLCPPQGDTGLANGS